MDFSEKILECEQLLTKLERFENQIETIWKDEIGKEYSRKFYSLCDTLRQDIHKVERIVE